LNLRELSRSDNRDTGTGRERIHAGNTYAMLRSAWSATVTNTSMQLGEGALHRLVIPRLRWKTKTFACFASIRGLFYSPRLREEAKTNRESTRMDANTEMARGERRTLESMATPCSANA
jgi:hypothetical protein